MTDSTAPPTTGSPTIPPSASPVVSNVPAPAAAGGASGARPAARILIADDDPIVADSFAELLQYEGYAVATANDGHEALTMLRDAADSEDHAFAVLIADVNMPRTDGMQMLRQIRRHHPTVVPIIVTGYGTIEAAVDAVKLGAFDYLTKPLVDRDLVGVVEKAVRQQLLLRDTSPGRSRLAGRGDGMESMIGHDRKMQRVYETIEAVAPTRSTVLLHGDSGTGKTMVARAVHNRSPRHEKPFIVFSCGSIPETLLESELFGHVRGAFTGADADKPGKLRAADGGTLFIDEINSATPALQLKLLRVLQERQFEPVGSHETVNVDVRFVLAANQPLDRLVADGQFREDLYYRINVVTIQIPPLSQRTSDVPGLADHFLHKYCRETGKIVTHITDEAMAALMRYRWPGNVRELENAIERAVVLCRRPVIDLEDLPETIRCQSPEGEPGFVERRRNPGWFLGPDWQPQPLREALQEPEKAIILAALRYHHWNRQKTAADLDINRTTLYKKIKQYGLEELAAE